MDISWTNLPPSPPSPSSKFPLGSPWVPSLTFNESFTWADWRSPPSERMKMDCLYEFRGIFIGSFCTLLILSHQEGLWIAINNDQDAFIFSVLSDLSVLIKRSSWCPPIWASLSLFTSFYLFDLCVFGYQWTLWRGVTSDHWWLIGRGGINFFHQQHLPSFRVLLCIVKCQNVFGEKISDQCDHIKGFLFGALPIQCWKGLCPHRKLGIHVEGSERSSLTERRWHKPNRASTEEGRGAAGCSTAPVASPSVHHSDLWPLRKVKPIVLLRTRLRQMWYRVFAQFMSKHLTTWPTEEIHFDLSISDWHPGPRMSASDQMRAMLDQLMGTQRNGES